MGCKHPRAAPQPHWGLADPTPGPAWPVPWHSSDVAAPDVSVPAAKCPPGGPVPGQAPQICLGWVRTNPWLSRNAQEPRHPHTWLAPGGGKWGSGTPKTSPLPQCLLPAITANTAQLLPAPKLPVEPGIPQAAAAPRPEKPALTHSRCFPALAAPVVAGLEKQENTCRARQMSGSWDLPHIAGSWLARGAGGGEGK